MPRMGMHIVPEARSSKGLINCHAACGVAARTDARQAESLEEALWRVAAFADAGADIVFVDALTSVEEMRRLCATAPRAYKVR